RAIGLMFEPQPSEFDCLVPGARVARLADPLLAVGSSAAPRTGRKPTVARDLAAIVEVLVEHLVGQRGGEHRPYAFEPLQHGPAPRHLGRGIRTRRRVSRMAQLAKLLAHQRQPGMLTRKFRHEMRPEGIAVPVTLCLKPLHPVAPARITYRHALEAQQRRDPLHVRTLLPP